MDCRPSLRGEIKKARHSQYDLLTCLFEFIDNAFDTNAEIVRLEIKEKQEVSHYRKIIRICISDNSTDGIPPSQLSSIFSWTYDRTRKEQDMGEFGTGFKCAAVNLGSILRIMTHSVDTQTEEIQYWEAMADWESMMDQDRWDPNIHSISFNHFKTYHPFERGTTFLIDNLLTELFQTPKSSFFIMDELRREMANCYKYYFRQYPHKKMELKGQFADGQEMKYLDAEQIESEFLFPFDQPSHRLESQIHVYQDQAHYLNFFISKQNARMIEMVECLEKRKNGNHHLRSSEISHRILLNMTFLEDIPIRSCYYKDGNKVEDSQLLSHGSIDFIYRHRLIGKNISFRSPRTDTWTDHIKHEIHLPSKFIFPLLGVSFNKKAYPIENELHFVCEYLQMYHERELIRKLTESVSLKTNVQPPFSVVSDTPPPISNPVTLPVVEKEHIPKRKNFTPETKLCVLQEQICRDSIFDFVLNDSILPFDYDHREGRHNNSKENCQILSVLSHALKTRKPLLFNHYSTHKLEFIVQLLNCITSSHIFLNALSAGKVQYKSMEDLTWSQGIFYCKEE